MIVRWNDQKRYNNVSMEDTRVPISLCVTGDCTIQILLATSMQ
jgi:hypothetical protein